MRITQSNVVIRAMLADIHRYLSDIDVFNNIGIPRQNLTDILANDMNVVVTVCAM